MCVRTYPDLQKYLYMETHRGNMVIDDSFVLF